MTRVGYVVVEYSPGTREPDVVEGSFTTVLDLAKEHRDDLLADTQAVSRGGTFRVAEVTAIDDTDHTDRKTGDE